MEPASAGPHRRPEAIAFGELIREYRAKGTVTYTQATLAEALDPPVTPGAVGQWEAGLTLPTTSRQMALVRLLGIPWNKVEAIYRRAA